MVSFAATRAGKAEKKKKKKTKKQIKEKKTSPESSHLEGNWALYFTPLHDEATACNGTSRVFFATGHV